jgi:hypothetical protein
VRLAWALAVATTAAAGCFDDSIPSSFQPVADAGADADGAAETGGDDAACPILVSTFVVVVDDAVSGFDVCDATVVATSVTLTFSLTMQGTAASCAYSVGQNTVPPGNYEVAVTAPGYQSATKTGVIVSTGPCGTSAPTVTIGLSAALPDASSDAPPGDAPGG